jgi:type III secretion system FlhB-like substrate exporter
MDPYNRQIGKSVARLIFEKSCRHDPKIAKEAGRIADKIIQSAKDAELNLQIENLKQRRQGLSK